jgi:hypothetical protein
MTSETRSKTMERFWIWLAWKLPRRLALWAAIRVNSEATVLDFPDRTPEQVSVLDAIGKWR